MKKRVLLLASGVCLFLCQAMASTVSVQTAQLVATNFFKGAVPGTGTVTPTLVYTRTEADQTVDYYVFDMSPARGFVAVAADDIIRPILAYSTESSFAPHFEKAAVNDWVLHTAQNIYHEIQNHTAASANITFLWSAYKAGPYSPSSRTAAHIGPLLRSTWNQEPYYNANCPYNTNDNQRSVTGCVATAMAQVMRYWSYPSQGTGSNSYDCYSSANYHYGVQTANFNHGYSWANMTYNLGGGDSGIARTMYEIGVSVNMSYGDNIEGGSGAFVLLDEVSWGGGQVPCSQTSYVNHFKYDPNTIQGIHLSNYTSADWFNTLKAEVDAGRVVQYEGYDPSQGGHTWVMDGYDVNGLMHMNWGWGGADDGYFAVTSLSASGANFNTSEAALIGIQPLFPYNVSVQAPASQLCIGTSMQLTAQGPTHGTYSWYPTTGLSCSTCAVTTATPTTSIIYTVTCDSAGVRVPSSILVTVVPSVSARFTAPVVSACSTPATITFTNASQNASSYVWDYGDGTTGTSASHQYAAYGTYDVKLRATGQCGVDSLTQHQYVSVTDNTPALTGQTVCSGATAVLRASTIGNVSWFTAAAGGSAISTDMSYTTPALTASTTYYAQALILGDLLNTGPADNTIGAGSYYTSSTAHSTIFNCTSPVVLSYVDVYAQAAGTITVTLTTASGTVLQTGQFAVDAGANTLNLNFNVPAGTGLKLSTNGNPAQLYRNNANVHYPYYSPDSTLVLTGSDAGASYYFFFYNWLTQSSTCVSNRIPVTAYVLSGTPSFSYSSATGNVVTFTTPMAGATSYAWDFGDGTTSTDQNPVHTYATAGTYSVSLVVSSGSCSETAAGTISAAQGATAIHDLDVVQSMSTYPNPVRNQLDIKINAAQAATVQMAIYDMVGNVLATRDVKVNIGANSLTEDVASYASGVYMIVMQDGNSKATSRFIKE